MIHWESDSETVHALLVRYLGQRSDQFDHDCAEALKRGRCRFYWDGPVEYNKTGTVAVPAGRIIYRLVVYLPPDVLDIANDGGFHQRLCESFSMLIDEECPQLSVNIKALVELPPSEGTGLNNCFFKTDSTIAHDELRFRSKGEVAIYNELRRRNILFFPNPAAVLGNETTPELVEKREPDFLICAKGKWGIMEVNGEPFHSGPVTTAKDHERFRLFQRHGLFFVQAYDSERCKREPAKVVNDFLRLLEQSR